MVVFRRVVVEEVKGIVRGSWVEKGKSLGQNELR